MTFEEKLKHSDIISSGYLEKGKDVKTTKSRIIGILLTLIIAAYTVFTTIRKYQTVSETSGIGIQDQALLILSFVVIFLKVISSIVFLFFISIIIGNEFTLYDKIFIVGFKKFR